MKYNYLSYLINEVHLFQMICIIVSSERVFFFKSCTKLIFLIVVYQVKTSISKQY